MDKLEDRVVVGLQHLRRECDKNARSAAQRVIRREREIRSASFLARPRFENLKKSAETAEARWMFYSRCITQALRGQPGEQMTFEEDELERSREDREAGGGGRETGGEEEDRQEEAGEEAEQRAAQGPAQAGEEQAEGGGQQSQGASAGACTADAPTLPADCPW